MLWVLHKSRWTWYNFTWWSLLVTSGNYGLLLVTVSSTNKTVMIWLKHCLKTCKTLRDRPFNLKGWGYGFLFRSEIFFLDNTRVRIFIFFVAQSAIFFSRIQHDVIWQKLWIRFFFSSTKIRIFFSATLGIRIFFLEKNHNLPPHPSS